ncbi:MAG: internal scaffolding protein [Microvirus sp.]|nr:MAG: internal scaffolding protein [Microvirus sp.]
MSKSNRNKQVIADFNDVVDPITGELINDVPQLGVALLKETVRPDGSRRIQMDYTNCPTMAEQHTAHLTNINYLIEKYKPDELQAYINARSQYRQEILGHDFSQEPNLQEAKNVIYESKKAFQELPDSIKNQFKSHLEFLKFIDNPANEQKMLDLGILKPKEIEKIKIPDPVPMTPQTQTTT